MPATLSTSAPPRRGYRASSTLAWWIFVAIILGVVGWLKTINILLLVSYVLGALLGLNAILAYRMTRRLTAHRIPHPPAFAGEEVFLRIEMANHSHRSKSVHLREDAPRDVAAVWFLPHFGGLATVHVSSGAAFASRGRHKLPPLLACSGYPFGLLSFQRPLSEVSEQLVLPPLGTVNARLMKRFLIRAGHGDDRSKRPPARHMPSDGDVRGLRPHRQGDGMRDIHWKTSARRGQWMVREYDQTAPLDLVILVDPWVPSTPTDRISQRKLEWALSLAVTAAWAWVHEERPGNIALIVFEETISVHIGSGAPRFVREGFAKLAAITGTPHVSASGVNGVPVLRSRAARLLISTRPRSPIAGAIRAAGLALAVVDPTSPAKWFSLPPAVSLPTPTEKGDGK